MTEFAWRLEGDVVETGLAEARKIAAARLMGQAHDRIAESRKSYTDLCLEGDMHAARQCKANIAALEGEPDFTAVRAASTVEALGAVALGDVWKDYQNG